MEINKETLAEFRLAFADTVSALEEKYGIEISLGNITFDYNTFHATLNAQKKGLTNAQWNWHAADYGLKPEDLGKTFFYNRKRYTITGIKRGNKYPITTMREDGKEFSFTAEAVKQYM